MVRGNMTGAGQPRSPVPALEGSGQRYRQPSMRPVPAPSASTDAPAAWLGPVAVLVPVKAFAEAKVRLAPALGPAEREALARSMAAAVVMAAAPLPVAVVCDDVEVASWARANGALVVWEPGRGLNGAVEAGVNRLAGAGVAQVIVAHADLPRATHLAGLTDGDGVVDRGRVTLVPDRRRDGTNVAVIPAAAGFRFSYGPGSFERHQAEARRLRLELRIVDDPLLAFDVDLPIDLETLA
jgi:2-phospho-L-lactate guanylyltransferase